MKLKLAILLIITCLISIAQAEQISKDMALRAIADFEKIPIGDAGKEAAALFTRYAIEGKAVSIRISIKLLPWLKKGDVNDLYTQTRAILLSAYIAGNVKSQLIRETMKDDPYSGFLQVLRTYNQLKLADSELELPEIESLQNMRNNNQLKGHIKKATARVER